VPCVGWLGTQMVRASFNSVRTLVHVSEHAPGAEPEGVASIPAGVLWYELCKLEEENTTLRRAMRDLQYTRHLVTRREQRDLDLRLQEARERRRWIDERLRVLEGEHRRRREQSREEECHELP
jgi:hypothetical protein